MKRMLKFVEVAWVIIAVISAVEVYSMWGDFNQKFWIFAGFMLLAIFMFVIRRRQRKRYEAATGQEEVDK